MPPMPHVSSGVSQPVPASAMTEKGRHRLGVALVAGAKFWRSTCGVFIRSVHADSWTTIFWRWVSAAATMFLFLAIRKRVAVSHFRGAGWPGVLLGLCFCGVSTCHIPAMMLTSVANIALGDLPVRVQPA
jgi:hypothetical protein